MTRRVLTVRLDPQRPDWTVTLLPEATPGWWTVTQHGRTIGRLHHRIDDAWVVHTGPYQLPVGVYRTRREALRALVREEGDGRG